MSSSTRTGFKGLYQMDLTEATAQIDAAIARGLPTHSKPYKKVTVLMMHWDNDDMGVNAQERELAHIFTDVYNFTVESYLIPTTGKGGPAIYAAMHVANFVKEHQGPQNLLIIVYSGHARAEGRYPSATEWIWYGSQADPSRNLNCAPICGMVDGAEGDALCLLDCGHVETPSTRFEHSECLVATPSMRGVATEPHDRRSSFTQRLINILKANAGAGISIVQLHALMLAQIKTTNASFLDTTPVHIGAKSKTSIVLIRHNTTECEVQALLPTVNTEAAGKVLISLKTHGYISLPDVHTFEKWLLSKTPEQVASVKVEAFFQSSDSSSNVLFTVPFEIWDCLDGVEGFQLVDYVDSHNLMMRDDSGESLMGSKEEEEVKGEDVKEEGVKQEDVKQEDVKQEDVKQEDVKQEDVKQENVKQEDVKQEDVKQENVPFQTSNQKKRLRCSD
ncbi:MAG: hypothetical protein Q9220_003644 [cf. Caloplaca sp. 1 TL-2023]